MINKNKRYKLYEFVVEELGLKIIKGEYKPGDTLPNEEMLSREFEVSRGVLREATKVLVKKGLIRLKPKIGTQIQPQREWNLFDPDVLIWKFEAGDKMKFLENIIELRRIIESEAAKLVAERGGEKEVLIIRSNYDRMVRFLDDKDSYSYEEYIKLDFKFHTSILEACRNELFSQIGYTIRQALLTARQIDKKDIKAQKETLPLHLDIVNAIENHKPEAAYCATQTLVSETWGEIKEKISRSRFD
jgi:GntR family transcriptional regulator, galactonate operon transcriptional repressor